MQNIFTYKVSQKLIENIWRKIGVETGNQIVDPETQIGIDAVETSTEHGEHDLIRQLIDEISEKFPGTEVNLLSNKYMATEYVSVPEGEGTTVEYFIDNILKVMGTSGCKVERSRDVTRLITKEYLIDIFKRSKDGRKTVEIAISRRG